MRGGRDKEINSTENIFVHFFCSLGGKNKKNMWEREKMNKIKSKLKTFFYFSPSLGEKYFAAGEKNKSSAPLTFLRIFIWKKLIRTLILN